MTSSINFLKMKNKLFFRVAMALKRAGRLEESLFLLESDSDSEEVRDYFSLLGLYFEDEGGYDRSLFIPLPIVEGYAEGLLPSPTRRAARHILAALNAIPDTHVVSREWHDGHWGYPTGYFPVSEEEEVYE